MHHVTKELEWRLRYLVVLYFSLLVLCLGYWDDLLGRITDPMREKLLGTPFTLTNSQVTYFELWALCLLGILALALWIPFACFYYSFFRIPSLYVSEIFSFSWLFYFYLSLYFSLYISAPGARIETYGSIGHELDYDPQLGQYLVDVLTSFLTTFLLRILPIAHRRSLPAQVVLRYFSSLGSMYVFPSCLLLLFLKSCLLVLSIPGRYIRRIGDSMGK